MVNMLSRTFFSLQNNIQQKSIKMLNTSVPIFFDCCLWQNNYHQHNRCFCAVVVNVAFGLLSYSNEHHLSLWDALEGLFFMFVFEFILNVPKMKYVIPVITLIYSYKP